MVATQPSTPPTGTDNTTVEVSATAIEGVVARTLPLAGYTGVVLCMLYAKFGVGPAFSAFVGLILNLAALWSLQKLVPMVLRPLDAPPVNGKRAGVFAALHLFCLTAILPAAYFLNVAGLLLGYTYPLVILLLKVVGRAMFGDRAPRRAAVVVLALAMVTGVAAAPVQAAGQQDSEEHFLEASAEEGAPHGKASGHGDGHDAHHDDHHGPPHVPTVGDVLDKATHFKKSESYVAVSKYLGLSTEEGKEKQSLEYLFWYFFTIALMVGLLAAVCAKLKPIPTGMQALLELYLGFIEDMVMGVIGEKGRRYIPFVATLFLFILFMNYLGMIPGYYGPTGVINTTAALAVCVFIYAQYEGIRTNGFKHYFMHFVGEPLWMAPLMFPLHVVGEFIKPLSLALRLFGNVNGEHILVAGFITLIAGISFVGGMDWFPVPIPVHLPLLFLGLLVGFIQAMVFSLLATIYIFLLLPHDDHGHDGHDHAAAH